MTEQSLNQYVSARATLVAEERKFRFDYKPITSYSEKELKAIKYVEFVRIEETENIWEGEATRPFLVAKPKIEKSKLFRILRKMPKGALLHTHFDATVPLSHILTTVQEHKNIFVASLRPLTKEDLNPSGPSLHPILEFKALGPDDPLVGKWEKLINDDKDDGELRKGNLWDESYQVNDLVPLHVAMEKCPGGPSTFLHLLQTLLSIQPLTNNPQTIYQTSQEVWQKFGSIFRQLHGLISYEPILRNYMRQCLKMLADDAVGYVELRVNFWYWNFVRADGQHNFNHQEFIKAFKEEHESLRSELDPLGFIGFKIIYTTLKFVEPGEPVREYMRDCMELKKHYPEIICGFDLVGHEDGLFSLLDYAQDLLWFQEELKQRNLEIPFVFHAGETLTDGDNLIDAILFDTKRIGHGFALVKHPRLMEIVKERGILTEMCPISNELLRYTQSPATHPLPILLAHGLPVALASDDATIFSNPGVSWDFYQAFVASKELTILSLGKLARQSLEFSLLPSKEKDQALKSFDKKFDDFLDELVASA